MGKLSTRAYCDTSVFGGVFDSEFSRASRFFLSLVRKGKFEIVISPVVEREINDPGTPPEVISEYERHRHLCTIADVTMEALKLQSRIFEREDSHPQVGG